MQTVFGIMLSLCMYCFSFRFRHAGGVEDWAVACRCGTRDDDGERMIVCDGCGFWMHTRCNGIRDEESEPHGFVCAECKAARAAEEAVAVQGPAAAPAAGSKRGRQ
jgi:hypothetical protein